MTKAIIFDLFGVLIYDVLQAMLVTLRKTEPQKADQIVAIYTAKNEGLMTSEDARRQIAETLGMTTEEYGAKLKTGETKNQELLAYILSLRDQHYRIGLLSNTGVGGIDRRFTYAEQRKYFDAVLASAAIGHAKPEARAYELAAEHLGVRLDECIMVDDREEYCEGARAAGMQAILYESVACLKQALDKLEVTV